MSLFMSIPGGGLEFFIINKTENYINSNSVQYNFLPGFIGGFTTSMLLTPIDYLKTQMQIQGSNINDYKLYKSNFGNHFKLLKEYYHRVGFTGLFRGCFIRGFGSCICFGSYEFLKRNLI